MKLKFINGVLCQSEQMNPGGPWTDYYPVPSEVDTDAIRFTKPAKKSLAEELRDAWMSPVNPGWNSCADKAKEVLLGEDKVMDVSKIISRGVRNMDSSVAISKEILNFLREGR